MAAERIARGLIFKSKSGRRWFGFEYAPVANYMQRWIVYFGWFNLRVHRFLRGDDDRAPHDHPFWFVTIPTRSYYEQVMLEDGYKYVRKVRAWLPHFRKAKFRHIVLGTERLGNFNGGTSYATPKPFFTFVLAGARSNGWGFWPAVDKFVPWREWGEQV